MNYELVADRFDRLRLRVRWRAAWGRPAPDWLAVTKIDAFVAGEPILRYEVANRFHGRLQVLGSSFMRQDYAFALPLNSELRRGVNESLLRYIDTDEWRAILRQYLGQERQ